MKTVRDLEIKDKKILLRTDYDVPLKEKKVIDGSRIKASLTTINYLLREKAKKIIILCHIDRPGGKIVEDLKVKPVTDHLRGLLPINAVVEVKENLRFNPGESQNNLEFTENLAAKGDVFVNDAFAVSHRNHASIVSLAKFLPSAIGLHFEKELKALDKVISNPKRPLLFVIGGAKLETKLPLVEKLAKLADAVLVGGKLAQEIEKTFSPELMKYLTVAQLTEDGKDISLNSAKEFIQKIENAGTIVWNGPMGVFEQDQHSQGTKLIAQAINSAPGYTVIGGGDTEAAATKFNAEKEINHISMGGGAMLQYLAEGTLPGLEAIEGGMQ